jgi:hypothetical protein
MLERGMALCEDWHIPVFWPIMATALGVAYALDGRVAAGLALAEQGVEQVKQQVARGRLRRLALQAHCHLGLGTLYPRQGQAEQARAALSTAIEMSRAMDMIFWLPQAETAPAQVTIKA